MALIEEKNGLVALEISKSVKFDEGLECRQFVHVRCAPIVVNSSAPSSDES